MDKNSIDALPFDERRKHAQPKLLELEGRLLALGGEMVALRDEDKLDLLLSLGREFTNPVKRVRGTMHCCHGNVGRMFLAGKLMAICTGWALGDDGKWRQHSWGLDHKGKIVETTVKNIRYFGVYMTGLTAVYFAQANS
jgi:hypothetical protein